MSLQLLSNVAEQKEPKPLSTFESTQNLEKIKIIDSELIFLTEQTKILKRKVDRKTVDDEDKELANGIKQRISYLLNQKKLMGW